MMQSRIRIAEKHFPEKHRKLSNRTWKTNNIRGLIKSYDLDATGFLTCGDDFVNYTGTLDCFNRDTLNKVFILKLNFEWGKLTNLKIEKS